MPVDELFKDGKDRMNKTISDTKKELSNIRTGRANPLILDKVRVEYYGTPTPLRQLANISVQEGHTLSIQPFDKSILHDIEKALNKADLGVSPNNDGITIRISFPPLTEDRRKELVKDVKKIGEEKKVAIRNIRRDMADKLKKLEKDLNLPEDEVKKHQDVIQKQTDKFTKEIDIIVADKEQEVLTV